MACLWNTTAHPGFEINDQCPSQTCNYCLVAHRARKAISAGRKRPRGPRIQAEPGGGSPGNRGPALPCPARRGCGRERPRAAAAILCGRRRAARRQRCVSRGEAGAGLRLRRRARESGRKGRVPPCSAVGWVALAGEQRWERLSCCPGPYGPLPSSASASPALRERSPRRRGCRACREVRGGNFSLGAKNEMVMFAL